jgi:hypothetical protein
LQLRTDTNGDIVPIIRGSQVGIYIDEMQSDASILNGFSVSDIAMVKVIKGFFAGGIGGGGGGAVVIYTKRGNMRTLNRGTPSLNHSSLKGYEKPADFPSPDYNESIYRQLKSDTRDVLFWNAFAVTENEQLKVPIRFYNSDSAKEYRVIIVGFTIDNEPVYFNGILK